MPIYAYRCSNCGRAKDVLQKMSDPLLTVCPFCGEPTFVKQLTAAGFQLKGSGWYVTDFRGGDKPASGAAEGKSEGGAAESKPEGAKTDGAAPAASKSEPASSPAPAPAPTPTPSSDKK